jgi:hypothetical protein
MNDRIDNKPLRTLDRWRTGQPVSARHENQVVDAVTEMQRGVRPPRQVMRASGGKGEAEEVSTTAPVLIVVGEPDTTHREDSIDWVRAWAVSRTLVSGQWKYFIGAVIGNLSVWPGRNLGWYRANVHMYPWDAAIGTAVETSHLRQVRIMRVWDTTEEHYVHSSYVS